MDTYIDGCIATTSDSRPWLTMLHGYAQNAVIFDKQKEYFEHKYRIFTPELLGHGRRMQAGGGFALSDYVNDIYNQINERGIEHTHFWGTHTGSAVGLMLALNESNIISSLILEAAVVPGIAMPTVVSRIERARRIASTIGLKEAMSDWFQEAEWFRSIRENPVRFRAVEHREIVMQFMGANIVGELPKNTPVSFKSHVDKIKCPILLYNGCQDVEDFKCSANWLNKHLPVAKQVNIPGLGGFPAWEDPGRVNSMVDKFLTAHSY